jgi:CRP-like cAMP-binding protein
MFKLIEHTEALRHQNRRSGELVYERGQDCDGLIYVVLEGEICEMRKTQGNPTAARTLLPGALFGDIEVMSDAPLRLKSYVVKSVSARLAIMEKHYAVKLGSLHPEFFLILLKNSIDELHAAEVELLKK